jgi:hypothetical protein
MDQVLSVCIFGFLPQSYQSKIGVRILIEWHDRKIAAGDDWEQSIDEHVERADIILLLVSPVFIASALQKHWGPVSF